MKILLLITGLGMGGAEKVVAALADGLKENGHSVCIVYMTGPIIVKPRQDIEVINLKMQSGKDFFCALQRLRKKILDFKPDVLHSHMVHANLLARVVRLFVKIPRLISTAHNTREGGRIRMLAYRLTDGLADISTNVSEEAVESFISAGAVKPGRMIALHNSVDICRFQFRLTDRVRIRSELGCPDGVKVLLAVGRLHEQKDYPMLFRALKLVDENSNYVLWIAGEGSLRSELQALAKNLGIEERVLFLGIRDDVSALMSAANIFVFPSAYEGFGLVVAEAMACERVVVATNSGGVKEVLGECGFLVPPQNPELFAQGIKRALALSPENSLSLGKIARKRVSEFYSFEAALCKWIALYEKELPLQVKRAV